MTDFFSANADSVSAPARRAVPVAPHDSNALADYGNRIPSLTFEVVADAGPVAVGEIAAAAGAGRVAAAGGPTGLPGFSAYGDSVRGVLETLASASGGWFAADGAVVRMRFDGEAAGALADPGYAATPAGGARGVRTLAAAEAAPRTLTVAHYDPARDYQTGLQRARRPGAGLREERLEMPAALSAAAAKAMAEAALARREAERERRRVALSVASLAVAPGERVTLAGESGRWRVAGWTLEQMVLTLELVRIARAPALGPASAGRVLAAPDRVHGPTIVHAFELPELDDAILAAPRLLIAAAGTAPGWRRAALLLSLDDGARWTNAGATARPATLGTIAVPPAAGPAALLDLAATLEVELAHDEMTLADADDGALDAGINLALAGDELIQFGAATRLAPRRWRLARLLRGRRGTETAAGRQAAGDRFVLIERGAVVAIDLPPAALGGRARVLAAGVGDVDGPAEAVATVAGASIRPPAPVRLAARDAGGGDAVVGWTRRSRAGWRWSDGADAPLGEEREEYRITVAPAAGPPRDCVATTATVTVAAAERAGGPVAVTVRQSGTSAESEPAAMLVA